MGRICDMRHSNVQQLCPSFPFVGNQQTEERNKIDTKDDKMDKTQKIVFLGSKQKKIVFASPFS